MPVNVDASVAVMVYVAVSPTSRLAVVLSEPLPLAVQVDPADAVHVHVAALSPAGKASVTVDRGRAGARVRAVVGRNDGVGHGLPGDHRARADRLGDADIDALRAGVGADGVGR